MVERISSKIRHLEKSEKQIKLESLNEATETIVASKSSILRTIRPIKTLDDAKLLNALSGVVRRCQVIINRLAVELDKDIYTGLLSNMVLMVFLLGELDVSDLSDFLNKVNKGLHAANQASPNAKTSIRSLLGVLKDDDMNRSLVYMLSTLKGMSRKDQYESIVNRIDIKVFYLSSFRFFVSEYNSVSACRCGGTTLSYIEILSVSEPSSSLKQYF